jgi:hypothetical protein
MNHQDRYDKITSSECYKLFESAKVKASYLEEKRFAKKMKAPMNQESNARPLVWGKFLEGYVFDLMIDYELTSQETIVHPQINKWSGTPDGVKQDIVFDIKCPYTRKSFCKLAEIIISQDAALLKKEYPEYYWQLISNAILTNKPKCELIVYLPKQRELEAIREKAMQNGDIELETKIYWIVNSIDDDLPHQPNESDYQSMYRLEFEAPQTDREQLIEEILKGVELI